MLQFDAPQDPNFFVHRFALLQTRLIHLPLPRDDGSAGLVVLLEWAAAAAGTCSESHWHLLRPLTLGCSLLLLTKEEDAYIEFLRLRNVAVAAAPPSLLAPLPLHAHDVMQLLRGKALFACKFEAKLPGYLISRRSGAAEGPRFVRQGAARVRRALSSMFLCNTLSRYVSYVRAYKEHQCSFIFQLKQFDYGALANQVH